MTELCIEMRENVSFGGLDMHELFIKLIKQFYRETLTKLNLEEVKESLSFLFCFL